ncbi:MAG: pyridoxal-phosphate dependent enzyme [Gemmatimonadales bacterium]
MTTDPARLSRKIRDTLAPCSLGDWPTPLEILPAADGREPLWVKREDRSSRRYGGSKVRGLEFLLAGAPPEAVFVTVGGSGSTHCLATAVHGGALGYRVVLAQFPQPATETALAVAAACTGGSALVYRAHSWAGFPLALARAWVSAGGLGSRRWIPGGGAHPRAVVGHFLAGLELAAQTPAPPDAIVAPLGSTGTVAGLCLAMSYLEWPTRVIAVRVASRLFANRARALRLANAARRLLLTLDASLSLPQVPIVVDGLGRGYGYPTPAGEEARREARARGLVLDSTYGGKAFATLPPPLPPPAAHRRGFPRVVFWHTFPPLPIPHP